MVILVGKWVNSFVKANEKKMNLIIDAKSINPYNNCNLRKIIYHQYLPMLIGISDQMRAQTDRLRCEVCQNLILSPINTGLLRTAVATVLTVHGIETQINEICCWINCSVATAPTVYGIETRKKDFQEASQLYQVATAPTVYGIETERLLNELRSGL